MASAWQGCGKQTPSTRKLFSHTNLVNVPSIKMWKIVWSRLVQNFNTWKKNAAAGRRLLTCLTAKFVRICQCAAAFFLQVLKLCTELDLTLLYILEWRTYSKFAGEDNFLALGVCFPQSCSSAGHMFAMSRSCLHHYQLIGLFPQQQIKVFCFWVDIMMLHTASPLITART